MAGKYKNPHYGRDWARANAARIRPALYAKLKLKRVRKRLLKTLLRLSDPPPKKEPRYKKQAIEKVCPHCGTKFVGRSNRLYCKPTHNPNYQMRKKLAKRKSKVPKWQSKADLKAFYDACPPGCVVDHKIPLNHPDICGLHVLSNLQYLPGPENMLKSNLWDGTEENENWRKLLTIK